FTSHATRHSFYALLPFTDNSTTNTYTLSLHDAFRSRVIEVRAGRCPSSTTRPGPPYGRACGANTRACLWRRRLMPPGTRTPWARSEEHTAELQSRLDLVCRCLLEKKKMLGMVRQRHE